MEAGQLSLDADVNTYLTSWKVPANEYIREQPVTLRTILSHTAGFTVHGFPGYASGTKVPTLVQVLNGAPPANTPAIRVDTKPGSEWRYSGGGYTVMQQMVLDVTHSAFPSYMTDAVLKPLGMLESSYQQPMPLKQEASAATGYYPDGSPVKGKWHIYPEMAAAGLWTTPSDLAQFAIGVQRSLSGASNMVVAMKTTELMLTEVKSGDGLGLFLAGVGSAKRFSHDGRDEGFDASMVAYASTGQGAVIMVNANVNGPFIARVMEIIAAQYKWPEYPMSIIYKPIPDREPKVTALIKSQLLQMSEGKYDKPLYTDQLSKIIEAQIKGGLVGAFVSAGPLEAIELVERKNVGDTRFYRFRLKFKNVTLLAPCVFDKDGKISSLALMPE